MVMECEGSSSSKPRIRRAASGGLKRSNPGVNRDSRERGTHYVIILDGELYVDHKQVKAFKAALKELCKGFDYKFVPYDKLEEEL